MMMVQKAQLLGHEMLCCRIHWGVWTCSSPIFFYEGLLCEQRIDARLYMNASKHIMRARDSCIYDGVVFNCKCITYVVICALWALEGRMGRVGGWAGSKGNAP